MFAYLYPSRLTSTELRQAYDARFLQQLLKYGMYFSLFFGVLTLLDRLFGTFHMPGEHWVAEHGTTKRAPKGLGAQLLYPITAPARTRRAPRSAASSEAQHPISLRKCVRDGR